MISLRKNVSILPIIMVLVCTLSLLRCSGSAKGSLGVLHVPLDFATIQEAIGNASAGDTILIAPGTYQEHLVVDRSLSLVGEDREATIIDGLGAQNVVSIATDDVIIESLTIQKSVFSPYDTGITVENHVGIAIRNTQIAGAFTGVVLAYCANSIFSNNIIINNTNGIQLLYSSNNTFSNNVVSENSEGISLYNSNDNVFSGNTLSGNGEGASITSGKGNYFYHNNFVDAVTVASGSTSLWSSGSEGNYWSDYNFTGTDRDRDGIGESAFYIDSNNQDDHPLMGVFSEFAVASGGEVFEVDIISNSTVANFRFETGEETGNKMVSFTASGKNSTSGFCRIMIPTALMDYPFVVIDREGEVTTSLLDSSNKTNAYLYFTYPQEDQSVTVTSSKSLQLYNELLDEYAKLETDLDSLNETYQGLLTNYNTTLQAFFNNFSLLLENFTQLQNKYLSLNSSLQKNLADQADSLQNFRNLAYVFAATTGAFLMATAYLSVRAHLGGKPKPTVGRSEAVE